MLFITATPAVLPKIVQCLPNPCVSLHPTPFFSWSIKSENTLFWKISTTMSQSDLIFTLFSLAFTFIFYSIYLSEARSSHSLDHDDHVCRQCQTTFPGGTQQPRRSIRLNDWIQVDGCRVHSTVEWLRACWYYPEAGITVLIPNPDDLYCVSLSTVLSN